MSVVSSSASLIIINVLIPVTSQVLCASPAIFQINLFGFSLFYKIGHTHVKCRSLFDLEPTTFKFIIIRCKEFHIFLVKWFTVHKITAQINCNLFTADDFIIKSSALFRDFLDNFFSVSVVQLIFSSTWQSLSVL